MSETKLQQKTLREWRKEFGLSRREVAQLAGCAISTVTSVELGDATLTSAGAKRVLTALDLKVEQVIRGEPQRANVDESSWRLDRFSESAPRKTLRWWRERRSLTQRELAIKAGFSHHLISNIERSAYKSASPVTRRSLASALRVSPEKLVLPGDDAKVSAERNVEDLLRAELRGTRKALKKAHDFMRYDPNIAMRSLDARDAILGDIEREVRGL